LTKRLNSAVAFLFASFLAVGAVAQTPLPALKAIHQLGNAEAGKELLVAFQTAVTHFDPDQRNICVIDKAGSYRHNVHFNILLCSPVYIAVLAAPSWLDVRHETVFAELLLFLVLAAGARGWYLEHKTRRQIGSLAYVEQRRSRILEDINHSEPLAEILERITELVSVRLSGAPCWCRVADGATLGNRPAQLTSGSLRIVEHPIDARSGPPLGAIYAALPVRAKPSPAEKEALAMAAGLATLAIETSRLYCDLVHHSEFDLLTDVPNRFSMEKTLDTLIQDARQSAGIFGLVYIDLNEFKQVNDAYGHQAGDLYLQEMARRMKRQLRPSDTLARLGGDEFAVLVSEVRNRAEVQEIATRLECCFEEPFMGEGYVVHGSASIGIALYPGDATTRDGLLSSADNAMYKAKYTRMEKNRAPQAQPEDQFAPKKQAQETARLAPGPTNH
jgi:diguanylate cyclase (GGDEF)-like protein